MLGTGKPERIYYPKIQTAFARDPITLRMDTTRSPTQELDRLMNGPAQKWLVSPKLLGVHIAAMLTPDGWEIFGRHGTGVIRGWQQDIVRESLNRDDWQRLRAKWFVEDGAALYGELVGPNINGNPHHLPYDQWLVFDVHASGVQIPRRGETQETWWHRQKLEDIVPQEFLLPSSPIFLNGNTINTKDKLAYQLNLAQIRLGVRWHRPIGIVAVRDGGQGYANRTVIKLETEDFE